MTTETHLAAEPEPTTVRADGPPSDVVVALAQMAPRLGDLGANVEIHQSLIDQAADAGADLVVFPELSLTGYFLKDLVPDVAVHLRSEELAALAASCRRVDALVGCVLESEDNRFFNACIYLSGGRVHHVHRKVYLPTYGLFDEQRYFAAGRRFDAFTAPMGRRSRRDWNAGTLICEDLWHPSAAVLLARQGIDVFLGPSASPARGVALHASLGSARSYDHITRTYAQLFTAYVVYCNRVGFEDGVGFWGGSRVVGPDGELVGPDAGDEEALVLHRMDLAAIRRVRIANPLLRDERNDVNDAGTDRLRR